MQHLKLDSTKRKEGTNLEKATKNFISDLKKQKRENKSLLFLDNVKIIRDALKNKAIVPECLLSSLTDLEDVKTLLHLEYDLLDAKIFHVDEKTLEQLSDAKTPQKVLCIAYHTQHVVKTLTTNFLVLDGLQDPGNVGTLIRTAKACGFESVFLVDCVRVGNPKLIRSSVGAVLDSQVYEMSKGEFVEFAKQNNLQLICADMNGENIFDFADTFKPSENDILASSSHHSKMADNQIKKNHGESVQKSQTTILGVVVGNEGNGVSDEIANLCFKTVKIPMKPGIESLNAGVSGSIIMYALSRWNF